MDLPNLTREGVFLWACERTLNQVKGRYQE
jgi:hypothetical protein